MRSKLTIKQSTSRLQIGTRSQRVSIEYASKTCGSNLQVQIRVMTLKNLLAKHCSAIKFNKRPNLSSQAPILMYEGCIKGSKRISKVQFYTGQLTGSHKIPHNCLNLQQKYVIVSCLECITLSLIMKLKVKTCPKQ